MRSIHPIALLALFVGGCAFVGDGALGDKLKEIDADNDGVPGVFDCDDANPLRRPGTVQDLPENQRPDGPQKWEDPDWKDIPYDGIDNNCDLADQVDVDDDLFPGISRTEYAQAVVNSGLYSSVDMVPWPSNVFEDQVDCDDENAAIFPNAPDQEYNGIDEDCQRDNDFDFDGDGQMPPDTDRDAVAAFTASTGIQVDLTAPNAFGDCHDRDKQVYAGNPHDEPYDGHDSNCDGSNDFDIDGDGYRPDGFDTQFQAFVELYHPVDAPAWVLANLPGDCLDQGVAAFPSLLPENVNPGIPASHDVAYDGVDADCAGDTDYDADGDGHTAAGYEEHLVAYEAAWSTGEPPHWQPTLTSLNADEGDCDDNDPDVAPGKIEVMGDGADSDCDGLEDATPFAYSTLAWEKPSWPRMVKNAEHYLVVTNARWAVRRSPTGSSQLPDAAPFLFFPADPLDPRFPGYQAEPLNVRAWANTNPVSTDPRSPGLDVVAVGSRMFVGNSFYTEANGIFKMGFVQRLYSPLGNDYGSSALATRFNTFVGFESDVELTFHPEHGTLQPDAGWLWMTMCGGSGRITPYGAAELDDETMPAVLSQMVIRTPFTIAPLTQDVPISPASGAGQIDLTGTTADQCWHEVTQTGPDSFTSEIHVCDVDGCQMYTSEVTDADTGMIHPTPMVSVYDGEGVIEAQVHDDLLVLVTASGVTIENRQDLTTLSVFHGEAVVSADAMITADGMLYVAAVIEASPLNQLKIAYGLATDFAATEVIADLPVEDSNPEYLSGANCDPATRENCVEGRLLEPRQVGLHVDDQRVAIAVSAWTPGGYVPADPMYLIGTATISAPGPQDAVGWAFMAPAPVPSPVP